MLKKIIIGNSGWSMIRPENFGIKDWKKKYRGLLAFYASIFDSAEINFTFYHLPKISTAEKWKKEIEKVNRNFEFTVKASRIITHTRKFEGKECFDAYKIIKEFALALDAKIILFQSPQGFKPTKENIIKMKNFFNKVDRKNILLAWEPRGEWYEKKSQNQNSEEILKNLLKELDLIHAVDPLRNQSLYQGKEKILYFRLHGFGQPSIYLWQFTDKELKKVYAIIKKASFRKAYIFFNNARQYEDALRFKKLISKNE